MSTQPVTKPNQPTQQDWVTLLEHAAEVGIQDIGPFAKSIGSLVNMFAPNVGNAITLLIEAVTKAEAQSLAAGQKDNGTQKLSQVMTTISGDISKYLQQQGRPSGTEAVTAAVNQTVSTLRTIKVPASGVNKVSVPVKQETDTKVSTDPQRSSQPAQQVTRPAQVTHNVTAPQPQGHQANVQESPKTPIVNK
jgi:hypothetical protein